MSPSSCEINPNRSLERACGNRELLAWKETLPKEMGLAAAAAGPSVPPAAAGPGAGSWGLQGEKLASREHGNVPDGPSGSCDKILSTFLCQEGGAALEADGEGCCAGQAASTRAELGRSSAGRRRAWAPPSITPRTCLSTSLSLGPSCRGLRAAAQRGLPRAGSVHLEQQ